MISTIGTVRCKTFNSVIELLFYYASQLYFFDIINLRHKSVLYFSAVIFSCFFVKIFYKIIKKTMISRKSIYYVD